MPQSPWGLIGARRGRLGPPAVEYVVLVVAIALILAVGAYVLGDAINTFVDTESTTTPAPGS